MSISDGMMKILNIVAEKTNGNNTNLVHDTKVIENSHLPKDEVYNYLYQLESLNLIKIAMKVSGADFVLINITKEGLEKVLGLMGADLNNTINAKYAEN